MSPRRCQNHYPRVHQPNPEGFPSIYVTLDLSLLAKFPLSVIQAVLHSPLYSLLPGVSWFKFTVSAAQTCWGYPVLHLKQNTSWIYLFFVCLLCNPICLGGMDYNICIFLNDLLCEMFLFNAILWSWSSHQIHLFFLFFYFFIPRFCIFNQFRLNKR